MENLIYVVLLALHNIALVGCAAAPFYNLRLANQRKKYGPKVFYEPNKVVEDTIQGLEPYCWVFILTLFVTGLGFPAVHYAFHGAVKETSSVALIGSFFKHVFVLGIVGGAFYIAFFINPKIKAIFSTFSPSEQPDEANCKIFFALRAKRMRLCKICFVFALLILIVTPLLRFY